MTPEQVDAAMEAVSLISETIVGFRNTLLAGGFGEEAADELATMFGRTLIEGLGNAG